MPAFRKLTPSYLPHKQSGRGRAVWYDHTDTRRQKLLPVPFNSSESRAAFARFQLELESAPAATCAGKGNRMTMAELLCAYLDHARRHYRGPDGKPTSEIYEVNVVIRALVELYSQTPASEFGPLALKAARQKWVNEGRSRTECNRRVGMVKRIFKWAVSEELVPAPVYQALATVTGLQRGRTTAREMEPVGPVADAVVDATLPHLNRFVAAMVEFQRLTGCRPGEVCTVRRRDIDTGGRVWHYNPPHHKTAWRGKSRSVAVGPKAQEVLKQFLTADLDEYIFSPRKAVEELLAERSANRKTPRYPRHVTRNVAKRTKNPQRAPKEKYDRTSYARAVARACDEAFPPPAPLGKRSDETQAEWEARLTDEQQAQLARWRADHRWHPNQLRHSYATKARKLFDLEHAGAALGHTRMSATEVYAERDSQLAATVAAKMG